MEEKSVFLPVQELTDGEIVLRLRGLKQAEPARKRVPAYLFDICRADGERVGTCDLRLGHTPELYYGGNIGYTVEEPFRGHHYAGKACKLLFGLARRHDLGYVYITCNVTNIASAKTCEYAGMRLETIADLPEDNELYLEGQRQVKVYRFEL